MKGADWTVFVIGLVFGFISGGLIGMVLAINAGWLGLL